MLKSVKFYVFSKSMHKVCIFKNKKGFQFPESLVILVTPNFQSSNFLIEDLKAISMFVKEHASLLIAS